MCDYFNRSALESWKSPSPDDHSRVFFYCTPSSSQSSCSRTPGSAETYPDESFYGSSPHQMFTSFYISPLRCPQYALKSETPAISSALFTSQCETPAAYQSALGSGGFGRVVVSSYNRKTVALKMVRSTGHRQRMLLSSELLAFLVPASPFVVAALGFSVTEHYFHVMSELIDGGNLQSLLDSEEYLVESELKMDAIHQCSLPLVLCHAASILHLDVKPSNILFVRSTRSFKLAVFGCSMIGRREKVQAETGLIELLVCPDHEKLVGGTIPYQAPEIFRKSGVSCRSDIYSLGIC
ncbi:hypothetical protein PFISCL1PPCAC_22700, partial [Pristionchus fissidentatus]